MSAEPLKSASVISIHIDELKPAKYNPRKDLQPGDIEYEKIKKSIEAFGYVLYIVVNKDLTVIGGHQRLKVMKQLGYGDIEVTQVDLNKTQEKALNLALNKIEGEWNYDMLSSVIQDLNVDDFDITITGFDSVQVEALLSGENITNIDAYSTGSDDDNNLSSEDESDVNLKPVNEKDVFEVIIECSNEDEQKSVYEIINDMGYKCRVLTL